MSSPRVFDRELYDRASRRKSRGFERALYDRYAEERRAHGISGAVVGAVASKASTGTTPSAIMGANAIAGFRGDTGLSAAVWTDIKGGTALAGASNCTVVTSAINGMNAAGFTAASTQAMYRVQSIAAPGTTPIVFWGVVRVDAWALNNVIASTGISSGGTLIQTGSSPQLSMKNPTSANQTSGAAVGAWVRVECGWTNSTSDYLIAGSASAVTGASAGNTVGTHIVLGEGGGFYGTCTWAEFWYFNAVPTTPQRTALNAYVTSFYAGLVAI